MMKIIEKLEWINTVLLANNKKGHTEWNKGLRFARQQIEEAIGEYSRPIKKEAEGQPFDGETRVNNELYSTTTNGITKRNYKDLTEIDCKLEDLDEDTLTRLKQAQYDGGVVEKDFQGDKDWTADTCYGFSYISIYRLQKKPKTERFYKCVVDYGEDGRIIRWYNQLSIDRDTETGIAKVTKLGEYEDIEVKG